MKRVAKERKERALRRWKKRGWKVESLKRKKISLNLVRRRAKQEQVEPE